MSCPAAIPGLTHRVTLDGLADGEVAVVVKSTPPGRAPRGRHDVLRQARIMHALDALGEVPVAPVLFGSCSEPPFFASECVPGEAVDPTIAEDPVQRPAALIGARWERGDRDPRRPARLPTQRRSGPEASRSASQPRNWRSGARRWRPPGWMTTRCSSHCATPCWPQVPKRGRTARRSRRFSPREHPL